MLLILKRASASRPSGIGARGRFQRSRRRRRWSAASFEPRRRPWARLGGGTLIGTPTYGHEPTREAALAAFAKSWWRGWPRGLAAAATVGAASATPVYAAGHQGVSFERGSKPHTSSHWCQNHSCGFFSSTWYRPLARNKIILPGSRFTINIVPTSSATPGG
jgi:hypothetical protein